MRGRHATVMVRGIDSGVPAGEVTDPQICIYKVERSVTAARTPSR
jgi:hypothetical protein